MLSFITFNLILHLVVKARGSKIRCGIDQSTNLTSEQIQVQTAELVLAQVSATEVLH